MLPGKKALSVRKPVFNKNESILIDRVEKPGKILHRHKTATLFLKAHFEPLSIVPALVKRVRINGSLLMCFHRLFASKLARIWVKALRSFL
jgi:hypothetical protein